MVLEKELLPYLTWLLSGSGSELGAIPRFLITGAVLALLSLVASFLVALVRYGPLKAGDMTYRVLTTGFFELPRISPRRIGTLAWLAVKESLRRRVAVVLVVFFLILLFAGWFLKTNNVEPARLYLSFVLAATTYLILLISLLLSTFSLPNDFKTKTIYTVVTKPVRAGDIVLGRMLGFTLIGTALLAIMALCSYVFVTRALYHTHAVDIASLENIEDAEGTLLLQRGRSTLEEYHRHEIELEPNIQSEPSTKSNPSTKSEPGRPRPRRLSGHALSSHGHTHEATPFESRSGSGVRLSGPIGTMRARVPEYGKLTYEDRKGVPVAKGISVGSEWTYRSFIEGGSAASAIWTFEGLEDSSFQQDASASQEASEESQYLPIELIVRVFRTYQGNIKEGIQGSIQLRNPETGLKSNLEIFTAKDASINSFAFPRKLFDTDQNRIDLLADLVSSEGKLEVRVQCLASSQYFGFAQADCFLRLPDASPGWNFCKAYLSIWLQMVLVIAIGVTCSTFVNGPVAMMFTVVFILLGFFRDFFVKIAFGEQVGGGPVESLVRIVTQKNLTTGLDEGFGVQIMHGLDGALLVAMKSMAYLLPDFRAFSTADYVADGFNIPANRIAQDWTVGLAFVVGLFVIGYFFLRTREVAK